MSQYTQLVLLDTLLLVANVFPITFRRIVLVNFPPLPYRCAGSHRLCGQQHQTDRRPHPLRRHCGGVQEQGVGWRVSEQVGFGGC